MSPARCLGHAQLSLTAARPDPNSFSTTMTLAMLRTTDVHCQELEYVHLCVGF